MTECLPDLVKLLPSWKLALRAERKSPATVKSYAEGVYMFLRWCDTTGAPAELTKANAQAFVADLLDNGAQPKTASARLLGIRRFSAWLAVEGELVDDPLLGIKQPKLDKKVVEALTDEELRDLIKACRGKRFTDRRDEAVVRLMAEIPGLLARELAELESLQAGLEMQRRKQAKRREKNKPTDEKPSIASAGSDMPPPAEETAWHLTRLKKVSLCRAASQPNKHPQPDRCAGRVSYVQDSSVHDGRRLPVYPGQSTTLAPV